MLDIWTKSLARAAGVEVPAHTAIFETASRAESVTVRRMVGQALLSLGTWLLGKGRLADASEVTIDVGRLEVVEPRPAGHIAHA